MLIQSASHNYLPKVLYGCGVSNNDTVPRIIKGFHVWTRFVVKSIHKGAAKMDNPMKSRGKYLISASF